MRRTERRDISQKKAKAEIKAKAKAKVKVEGDFDNFKNNILMFVELKVPIESLDL